MLCPKCGEKKDRLLALSRIDNQTICDECGEKEALDSFPFAEVLHKGLIESGYLDE